MENSLPPARKRRTDYVRTFRFFLDQYFKFEDTLEEKLDGRRSILFSTTSDGADFLFSAQKIIDHPLPELIKYLNLDADFHLFQFQDTPQEREFNPEEYHHWFKHQIYLPMLKLFVDHLKNEGYSNEKITKTLGFNWQSQISA